MSLAIQGNDVTAIQGNDVTAVLLADGWHNVAEKSFYTDSYEYLDGDYLAVGGGVVAGVPSTGFEFQTPDGERIAGPLTALLAVKHTAETRH
ncbi:hypothetical protein AB0L62_17725 [Nocardia asteroides]|uniref:hypothetical protein n=1 Tax=Nocardia asteroides TaxID=1824 RepID=UPI0034292C6E